MTFENKAAWLTVVGAPLEIKPSPTSSLSREDILLKNLARAINLVGWRMQRWGIIAKTFPTTLGSDLVGKVGGYRRECQQIRSRYSALSGLDTAASGLFQKQHLVLPSPTLPVVSIEKSIIAWEATSNVCSAAVQLAAAAGRHVIATASAGKHAAVQALEASKVFDHHSTTITQDMIDHLTGHKLAGAFDAISPPDTVGALSTVLSAEVAP